MSETAPVRNPGDDLETWLRMSQIPVDQWGEGDAKTIDQLLTEIDAGESTFQFGRNGEIERVVRTLGIGVYHKTASGLLLKLVETGQFFADGRSRVRHLDTSIGEKLRWEEQADAATVYAALQEELGVDERGCKWLHHLEDEQRSWQSNSYPGLTTHYTIHRFIVGLNDYGYRPEGYVEEQQDKTTVFGWKAVNDSVEV